MPIFTPGLRLQRDDMGISELPASLGESLGATVSQAWADNPSNLALGMGQLATAKADVDFEPDAFGGGRVVPRALPAARIPMATAKAKVKDAGLDGSLHLGDAEDITAPALDIMMTRARERREREATMQRGPKGFIPGALDFGTSFLVGAVDPLNVAAGFIPVVGELRYGRLMAAAGTSTLERAAIRAGTGAASGAVGTLPIVGLEAAAATQEGRDYGMSDALHSLLMNAALGATLHVGGGKIADIYRRRTSQPLYPFREAVLDEQGRIVHRPEPFAPTQVLGRAQDEARRAAGLSAEPAAIAEAGEPLALPPAGAPERAPAPILVALADLPPQAKQDAMHMAAAAVIQGHPVQVHEALEAAGRQDPRIADALDAPNRPAPAPTVADDIHRQLLATGMVPEQAEANARLLDALATTLGARVGVDPLELHRREGIEVRGAGVPGPPAPGARTFAQAQELAPRFYSAVDRTISTMRQDKATPDQWLATIRNAPGVKAEEMEWIGLPGWLKDQKGTITKQQVQDFIRVNQVEVNEVPKGAFRAVGSPLVQDVNTKLIDKYGSLGEAFQRWTREEEAEFDRVHATASAAGPVGETKFGEYTLPGGENYRELLLTLPQQKTPAMRDTERYAELTGRDWRRDPYTPEEDAELEAISARTRERRAQNADETGRDANYQSSHWDEPNVLAHIRFDDRVVDGKKTLHIAEIQSDWAQAIRKASVQRAEGEGLKKGTPEFATRINELINDVEFLKEAGIPDRPWKRAEDWGSLALKRMIRYAAEHGYDRITWDTGATNAERYDLSKQVKSIQAQKTSEGYFVKARDLHGNDHVIGEAIDEKKIADHVGKDLAEKIIAQKAGEAVNYDGGDLKVGGEGMTGFYDRMLPAAASKLTKKFGGKVEQAEIEAKSVHERYVGPEPTVRQIREAANDQSLPVSTREGLRRVADSVERGESFDLSFQVDGNLIAAEALGGTMAKGTATHPIHSLDITPDLRKVALEQGFPLFQRSPEGDPRGRITLSDSKAIIELLGKADASTFVHEVGHLWLDVMSRYARLPETPPSIKQDMATILRWLNVEKIEDIDTPHHEQWARGFEQYLAEGKAPSEELAGVFERFKQWLLAIYKSVQNMGTPITDDIRSVMDRMLATDEQIAARRGGDLAQAPRSETAITINGETRRFVNGQPADPAAADAAWRTLSRPTPDYLEAEHVEASRAAAQMPEPKSLAPEASERIKAAEAAAAEMDEVYKASEAYLPEDLRVKIADDIKALDLEASDRTEVLKRGAACLAAAVGA